MRDDFETWAEGRAAAMLRFAYLVTGSQHAAEEAVQAALSRAFERWDRIRRTQDPEQYVRRMIANEHVSAWRRSGRREVPVPQVHERSSTDAAEAVVTGDAVWRACAGLPRQQRAAVVLRFYEDLGYCEIAAVLEVTEATARSHVHRALGALRVELEAEEQVDG